MGRVDGQATIIQRVWRGHRVRRRNLVEAGRQRRVETAALQDEEFDAIWGFDAEAPDDVLEEEDDDRHAVQWEERVAHGDIIHTFERGCVETEAEVAARVDITACEATQRASVHLLVEVTSLAEGALREAGAALRDILTIEGINRDAIAGSIVLKVPGEEAAMRESIDEAQDIARSMLMQEKVMDATTIFMQAMRVPFRLTPTPASEALQEDEEYKRYKVRSDETCCLTDMYIAWLEEMNTIAAGLMAGYPVQEASGRRLIDTEEAQARVAVEEARHLGWLRLTYSEAQVEILRDQLAEDEHEIRDIYLKKERDDFDEIVRIFSRRILQMKTWYLEKAEAAARQLIDASMGDVVGAVMGECTRLANDDAARRVRLQEEAELNTKIERVLVRIWDDVNALVLQETRVRCALENGQFLAFQNLLQVIRLTASQSGIHIPSFHSPLIDPVSQTTTRVEVAKRSKLPPTPAGGGRSAVRQLAADKGGYASASPR